ncbi:unnamed protein product [Paramecium primaurelia]|uniref:Uncharacterized protein n=1 Tax=Paramecium primaurelia TaxID=5886 RepID=A0A8S1LS34_PARPR|nr:unnamed protein product [Paramecium primaurelia]
MQNSLSYKLGLKNDNNKLFIARKTLVQRQELSKKYNDESQVVLVFEPHRFMTKNWAGAGPQFPIFAVVLSKDDPVENISTILKKKLQSIFHKDFQKYTYFLLCNNYLLSPDNWHDI